MELTGKWQDRLGRWQDFDFADIADMPLNHALNLFQQGTPVIAKQDETYIVNRPELAEQYKRNGKKVMLFSECHPSEKRLEQVGFL